MASTSSADERRAIDRSGEVISVELRARLRKIAVIAGVLAVLWVVASTGVALWVSGKIIDDSIADAAHDAHRDTAETASVVERIFHELSSIPYVLSSNNLLQETVVRYNAAESSFAGLTREARRARLERDPQVETLSSRLVQIISTLNYDRVSVVGSSGIVVASSNREDEGLAVPDRAYFREAMAGRSALMFAIARTTPPHPVFFFSAPIYENGSVVGAVVAIQASRAVELLLPNGPQVILIVDDNGMVVASSQQDYLLRHMGSLTDKRPNADILRTTYAQDTLKTIDAVRPSRPSHEEEWIVGGAPNLVTRASLQESGYGLLLLTPIEQTTNLRRLHYVIGALVALIGAFVILAYGRRSASFGRQRYYAKVTARLNEKLTAANVEKNRYLGIAAHDLRNPLASIRGLGQLLMEHAVEPSQEDEFHQTIYRTSDEMLGLVNDLLDVSVIESGKLDLRRTAVDTGKLVRQRVELLEPYARSKKIEIALDASGAPLANIDAARFGQVVDNLIGNAIKFSPSGTKVTVTLHPGDADFVFSVQDQGPGIAEAEHKLLFQSFQKLSARPTGGEKSTGLGLAIVKKIVDAHGGSIAVDSTPGSGTKFTVTVPLNPT
jgi:signal transduction histidine kinase